MAETGKEAIELFNFINEEESSINEFEAASEKVALAQIARLMREYFDRPEALPEYAVPRSYNEFMISADDPALGTTVKSAVSEFLNSCIGKVKRRAVFERFAGFMFVALDVNIYPGELLGGEQVMARFSARSDILWRKFITRVIRNTDEAKQLAAKGEIADLATSRILVEHTTSRDLTKRIPAVERILKTLATNQALKDGRLKLNNGRIEMSPSFDLVQAAVDEVELVILTSSTMRQCDYLHLIRKLREKCGNKLSQVETLYGSEQSIFARLIEEGKIVVMKTKTVTDFHEDSMEFKFVRLETSMRGLLARVGMLAKRV